MPLYLCLYILTNDYQPPVPTIHQGRLLHHTYIIHEWSGMRSPSQRNKKWPCSLGPYQSQPPRRTTCDQHAPFSFLPVRHPNRTNNTTPSHQISPSIPSFPPPNHHWFNPPPLLTGNKISERYGSDSSLLGKTALGGYWAKELRLKEPKVVLTVDGARMRIGLDATGTKGVPCPWQRWESQIPKESHRSHSSGAS